jgi:hypothetical protein
MAMFTKRHYEAIAGILAAHRRKILAEEGNSPILFSSIPDLDQLVHELNYMFHHDNQRFKSWEFTNACRRQDS